MRTKHTADRTIALRAAAAIENRCRQNGTTIKQELNRIGLERKTFYAWKELACVPSVYALQGMAICGYDVLAILRGY